MSFQSSILRAEMGRGRIFAFAFRPFIYFFVEDRFTVSNFSSAISSAQVVYLMFTYKRSNRSKKSKIKINYECKNCNGTKYRKYNLKQGENAFGRMIILLFSYLCVIKQCNNNKLSCMRFNL